MATKEEQAADDTAEPEYDVAISFLAKDETIARVIADRLGNGLKVFFFPHNQEELAGTNGLQSMREPFFKSRVVLVLFREPWGQTPWTRVESTAIGERCLEQGWESLMFVQLDKTSALPRWLPKTHIRFGMEEYGVDQLLGAIKARVQEQGGVIAPATALGEAARVQREREHLADRERKMSDRGWIEGMVHRSLRETVIEIHRLAAEANTQYGFQIQGIVNDMSCNLRSSGVSLGVGFRQPLFNRVGDSEHGNAYLRVVEFSGTLILPGEGLWCPEPPQQLVEHQFKVEVTQNGELAWLEVRTKELFTPHQLPDRIMRIFLDLVSRAQKGKI